MTSLRRSSSPGARLRSAASRRLALALGSTAALLAAILLAAAPAGAFISGEFGLQQRKPVWRRNGPLQYHNGKVIHASDSYAIYWDPLELYNSEWMRRIDQYFQDVGAASGTSGNVFALNEQYGETGYSTATTAPATAKEAHAADRSTFRGAYTDTDPYPPAGEDCSQAAEIVCLTDQDIKTELQKVIKSGALPGATGTVPGAQSTPVYYILTPPGVTVCAGGENAGNCSNSTKLEVEAHEIKEEEITHPAETGICGYHSTINPTSATPIVYAVQPWVAGDAGMFIESESPLTTSGTSADVLACQDNKFLEEPNQYSGLNPFAIYGAGLADVIVTDLADEQTNIVVDPLLNGWYQNAPSEEHGYPEQGDMCLWNFGPSETPSLNPDTHAGSLSSEEIGGGSYYLHWGFNSSDYLTGKGNPGCWQGVDLEPHITAPNPVNVGDVVGLDADESGITLDAAPLGLRQQKEETRLAEEVQSIGYEEVDLGDEIATLGAEEAKLSTEIAKFNAEEARVEGEITQLSKEEKRLETELTSLRSEKKADEGAGLTKTESEEFAKEEKRLTEERKRVAEEEAAAEKLKTSAEKGKKIAETSKRADKERKTGREEDERIVVEDKSLAKEEGKLADEHRLIKEREPLIAPIYKWDFGYKEKGVEATEEGEEKASVFHVFPCAGTYTVGLKVEDGGGNEAGLAETVTKTITVDGKSCEEGSSGGSSGPGSSGGSGSGGSSGSAGSSASSATSTTTGAATPGGAPKPPVPNPVVVAATMSRSLSQVLRSGLVVRYSVNEQVAGRFEVLLASSLAKRIELHGSPATGLPQGAAPQIVIAKAILVTTKGGRSTIKILFGKATAARLRKLRKVSLMLRLIVRNASSQSPTSTTVISTVNLGR